jgi:hypothetical protein
VQRLDSRWQAYWADRGLSLRYARLAERESAVVSAVAEVDIDTQLVPDELRRYATARVEAERDAWRRGEEDTLGALFSDGFGDTPGRYRIEQRRDPLARLVWASRRTDDEPWRPVLLVSVPLSAAATSWRVARSDLGFRTYAIASAWWTVTDTGGGWTLAQVEPLERGHHYLHDRLPNAPVDDDLHDDVTVALAVADGAVATPVAALTEVDAPVQRRLLDLSLVDERYAPDAIAACVREIARAWEAATERGEQDGLARWCTPEALEALLRPTPNGVRRVRNLEVEKVRIEALDTTTEPPAVAVTADLHGLRWLADRHGAHTPISGNDHNARSFTEHWTLRFEPQGKAPWRLTHVERPGRR